MGDSCENSIGLFKAACKPGETGDRFNALLAKAFDSAERGVGCLFVDTASGERANGLGECEAAIT